MGETTRLLLPQYRDLPHDAQLAVTVWGAAEARPLAALGGATMRLFSRKGRLKDGPQGLSLALERAADLAWPPATPAKLPLARRTELGCAPSTLPPKNFHAASRRARAHGTWSGAPGLGACCLAG